jgi:Tol biopolymer transport system component/predicted Ser/Thr protein kinase
MDSKRFEQIEKLYHAALACELKERLALLDQADPEVRREVELMLAQQGSALDRPAWDGAASLLKTETRTIAGKQMGPYRIEQLLGTGGMGQVFRATDTRLGREVAIKVAHEKFTGRFEREARSIAALNHANICTLYDVGPNYLVMEVVQGETLAARLKRGKLSLDQTILYGAQIASALSAAHSKGIVHRDLKPGNVMIAKAGVKVLDFGLAKSAQDETLTVANAVMGTPAYMAPEQREGKSCDGRTDIYALGLMLSEMATGQRTQPGEPPQLDSLPEKLVHVIERCLAQDPDDRWQSARDVKSELEWATHTDVEPVIASLSTSWRRTLPWALFGAAALGLAAFAWMQQTGLKNAVRAEPVRLQIPVPQKLQLTGALALSPDGRQLAFVASGADGLPRVYLRAMDSLEMRPLPGTESVTGLLFWKPDSRFIAFDSGGKLQKVDIAGGPVDTVCSLNLTGVGGTWNASGDILFGQFGGPIMRVSAAGGVAAPVTVLDKSRGDVAHAEPWFLPDGRHFLYVRIPGMGADISVGSLDAKPEEQDSRRLVLTSLGGSYAPSEDPDFGQMLLLRRQTLMAQPFDARHLRISGDPVRVIEEPVAQYFATGAFSSSSNGTLVYWSPGNVQSQLTWFDLEGKTLNRVGSPGPYRSATLSPDGTRVLLSRFEPDHLNMSLWLVDMSRGTSARIEIDPLKDGRAGFWAPDGRSIFFSSYRDGQMGDLYKKQMGGNVAPEALVSSNEEKFPLGLSPDGRFLLYGSLGGATKDKLWMLPLQGDRKPEPFLRTESDEPDASLSPDGRWVAYVSDESGHYEVYARSFSPDGPGQGVSDESGKWLISDHGGSSPRWRGDGKELYYIAQDGKLMAVPLAGGHGFKAGVPKVLFQAPQGANVGTRWAPAPDGKRFLFLAPQAAEESRFSVILNWQAGLKK